MLLTALQIRISKSKHIKFENALIAKICLTSKYNRARATQTNHFPAADGGISHMDRKLTYNMAISALGSALKFGIDPSLEPIKRMCRALGEPQDAYSCVQVAGTNGKSSTTRMIAALLRSQGLKVGTYTSPHLVKYPERIEIDGQVVSDRAFAEGIEAALDAAEAANVTATEFELLTAAALWLFAREGVDWAVLECGMGGRWDATSVCRPKVAVITGVALEHTKILGDTIEKIAGEKAAIIKPGSTAVFADSLPAREVFDAQAKKAGADVVVAGPMLVGAYAGCLEHFPSYQHSNAATALTAAQAALGYAIEPLAANETFRNLVIPGRFEVLRKEPLLMIDAAHNPQSARVLARELADRFITAKDFQSHVAEKKAAGKVEIPTLLLGVLADKDVRGVVEALAPLFNRVVVTASRSNRSISGKHLAKIVAEVTGKEPQVAPTIPDALRLLEDVPVIATGSITVAGEVKRVWC